MPTGFFRRQIEVTMTAATKRISARLADTLARLRIARTVDDEPAITIVLRCRTWRSVFGICGIAQAR